MSSQFNIIDTNYNNMGYDPTTAQYYWTQSVSGVKKLTFPITYNTPGLSSGFIFYCPTPGEVFFDSNLYVDVPWTGPGPGFTANDNIYIVDLDNPLSTGSITSISYGGDVTKSSLQNTGLTATGPKGIFPVDSVKNYSPFVNNNGGNITFAPNTALSIKITNASGGDPGATAGSGYIDVIIYSSCI